MFFSNTAQVLYPQRFIENQPTTRWACHAVALADCQQGRRFIHRARLATIQDCMSRSLVPWPDAWKGEYLDTIRKAVTSRQDVAQYDRRLEILSEGFPAYWQGLKKERERALFELHCAQIRWYVESLMDGELPTEQESYRLREQYKGLWDFAAESLLAQFPFLDPNAMHAAQADRRAECERRIEAPLLPIYLHPFSDSQMDQIKSRWQDLR
jgi:hypothetical protein